jgi:hypothetical protein
MLSDVITLISGQSVNGRTDCAEIPRHILAYSVYPGTFSLYFIVTRKIVTKIFV